MGFSAEGYRLLELLVNAPSVSQGSVGQGASNGHFSSKLATQRYTHPMKLSFRLVALALTLAYTSSFGAQAAGTLHARVRATYSAPQPASPVGGAQIVDAGWIKDAVTKHERVQLRHAEIRGRLELQDLTVENQFDLGDCIIRDYADFSHTTFQRDVFFSDATFLGGVSFQAATFEHKATFQRTHFADGAIIFEEAHFLDVFTAEGAQFGSSTASTASPAVFAHARFDATSDFGMSVFNGGADFIRAQFAGQGYFAGAQFLATADFGRAHFFDWTTFGSGEPPNFNSTFSSKAFFIETQFDSITWFNGVSFKDDAEFLGARFGSEAYFLGVTFGGLASFDRAQILGSALFSPQEGALTSDFAKPAHFLRSARFPGARLNSEARFVGVIFDDKAEFVGTHFEGDAHFERSLFRGPVSFRSTAFRAVYFTATASDSGSQFAKDVDLLGCTYDWIQVYWPSLLRYPNGRSRIQPFDRQPYIELADFLRRSGSESDADAVYLERQRVESRNLKGWRKLEDILYSWVANYGIDLWNEAVIALIFVVIGMLVFSRRGAVVKTDGTSHPATAISLRSAFFFAVHQFLPLSLPAKPPWSPSRTALKFGRVRIPTTAATYANFLQIIGWILIPLAAAALAGVLRRAAQ